MNEKKILPNKAQQRKKLLVALPILALPFLTLGFYALGGGQATAVTMTDKDKGFNAQLPDPRLEKKDMDKMAYYDQATMDSAKRKEQGQADPYYHGGAGNVIPNADSGIGQNPAAGSNPTVGTTFTTTGFSNPNSPEAKVYEKLGALNKALNQQQQQQSSPYMTQPNYTPQQSGLNTADVDRLEKMMRTMQSGSDTDDPQTKQLNGMLEKILDIQHPELVKEKIKASEDQRQGRVYAVKPAEGRQRISVLDNSKAKLSGQTDNSPGFYGVDDSLAGPNDQNTIEAVVHEDQTLVNGSIIKLRLTDAISVSGTVVPKDNFIYGTVSLDGERLTVKISSLRYKKSLFPVQLSVFDIDGQDGIYIPGAIARDVAKESADRSIQSFGLTSFDQSLGAQAAGAGIEAAKSFLSRKVKLIKVMVKAGYKVLLRDDKQREE
ncbi:conjugative transposon protein TraM [Mucilaginibacter sp. SMC90]|uniref:conjugative transposon protein TraM n=1 Tax=Mucilaginibacter sp. SMC90 TaxID=2929803 RepID=UPI001FB3950D|nr:conjugative transposon protein TraM [Mucilaginibacter sp. SMC90]UOE51356.1 conjugative transposon protein TraM [Mucilaginibacter sp. SMC90]